MGFGLSGKTMISYSALKYTKRGGHADPMVHLSNTSSKLGVSHENNYLCSYKDVFWEWHLVKEKFFPSDVKE